MNIGLTILVIIIFLGGVTFGVLLSNFKEPDGIINIAWKDDKCIWDIRMSEEVFKEKTANGSVVRLKFVEEKE